MCVRNAKYKCTEEFETRLFVMTTEAGLLLFVTVLTCLRGALPPVDLRAVCYKAIEMIS